MDRKVYPHAPEKKEEDKINKSTVASEIIDLRENGAPADHTKYAKGEAMSKNAIISHVLHGKNAPLTVNKIWDDIEAEKNALKSIPITGTRGDYQAELEKKTKYLDSVAFINGLMKEKEVKNWTELKDGYK